MLVSPTSHARTSQGHGSMKAVAALLLVGMLILWAELPTGRRCPRIRYGEEKLRCWEGATFTWILWEGERGGEGCLPGSISPGPLKCPGANQPLLLQAAPGPAPASSSPARCTTRGTSASSTGTAPAARSAASPSAERSASPSRQPSPSPTVGAREPPARPRVAERGVMRVALGRELCPAARAPQVRLVDKHVGWAEHQTQPLFLSLPFLSVSSGSQDRQDHLSIPIPPRLQDHSGTTAAQRYVPSTFPLPVLSHRSFNK